MEGTVDNVDEAGQREREQALFVVPRDAIDQATSAAQWKSVAAFHRINTLACIKSAEHGWLGACFSACEIMTTLTAIAEGHMVLNESCPATSPLHIVMSKGHAAAIQYACEYSCGRITAERLLRYKDGPEGLEAHADLLMDTGSLGQCLSTTAGMAAATGERYAVVLGDGELQEGQVFEALQTIYTRKATNITIIVDLNKFQSDNLISDIKPIANLELVFRGFGFEVERVDGHDADALASALRKLEGKLGVVLADTTKAGGTKLVGPSPHPETKLQWHPWHTKVPDWELYVQMVEEQLAVVEAVSVGAFGASAAWAQHRAEKLQEQTCRALPNGLRPSHGSLVGTGKAFGKHLVSLLETREDLVLLDGDLATSCGINGAVGHERFYEMGVAEQDMVSFAAGLSLAGKRPVVNTYSNFLKRAFENVSIALAEGAKLVLAGTYSGLCYHTDGKSHQSLCDMSTFSGLPGLAVSDPVSPAHAVAVADWALSESTDVSVYVRLRRTPEPAAQLLDDAVALFHAGTYPIVAPIVVLPEAPLAGAPLLLCAGTVPFKLAVDCTKSEAAFAGSPIVVASVINVAVDAVAWRRAVAGHTQVVTIEDDFGALRAFVLDLLQQLGMDGVRVVSCTVDKVGPSWRTLPPCLTHFGFSPAHIAQLLQNKDN
eukprot:m.487419 g.487419  ORF g.487419 m.487419 type:complete len:659 (+) comp25011_c0_seq1:89-2065(+)